MTVLLDIVAREAMVLDRKERVVRVAWSMSVVARDT